MITKIYVLTEPDGKIRYVGKTIHTLMRRFRTHLQEARRGVKNYRSNWVRSLLVKGYLPRIELIGEVDGDGYKEEIAWIAYGRSEKWLLTNLTDGGEGTLGHVVTKETRQKLRKAHLGRVVSDEARRNTGLASKGRRWSIKSKRKASLRSMGHVVSLKTRKKIGMKHKGKPTWIKGKHHSAETKLKISLNSMGRKFSKESRKKMCLSQKGNQNAKGHKVSEEARHKLSIASRNDWLKRRVK